MRQVTVLGSCGAFPEPGRACSGFAVDWDGYRLVLDLGYATLPRLLAHWPDGALDAIAITHEHPDHCIDLHGLFRMRFYGTPARPRLPLYCPAGVLSRLAGLEPDVDLTAVFDPHPLPGTYRAGPFELTGVPLPHFVPNTGIRVQAGEIALAYSGDTGPDPLLAELGRDADLFIVEATDRDGETRRPGRNLMTSAEAGRLARQAGARRLMVTHFWPGNDRAAATAAASAEFGRDALTAEEGLTVGLGDLRIPAIETGHEAAMVWCQPARSPSWQDSSMERVLGIGGYFVRAADPAALSAWYRDCLGLDASRARQRGLGTAELSRS